MKYFANVKMGPGTKTRQMCNENLDQLNGKVYYDTTLDQKF